MTESEARSVRDQALLDTDKYMLPDYPITPAGRLVIRIYKQVLRDWPKTQGFPDIATMPTAEDWSKYKPIELAVIDTEIPPMELVS